MEKVGYQSINQLFCAHTSKRARGLKFFLVTRMMIGINSAAYSLPLMSLFQGYIFFPKILFPHPPFFGKLFFSTSRAYSGGRPGRLHPRPQIFGLRPRKMRRRPREKRIGGPVKRIGCPIKIGGQFQHTEIHV